jgi:hypothetical protein
LNSRVLKVATPADAFIVSVPETPPGEELMVIEAVDPVTVLPFISCTVTTTFPIGMPAVPVVGALIANFVAGPLAAMLIGKLLAPCKPADVAFSVYVLAALNVRPVNVAIPPDAVWVGVPETPLGVEVSEITAFDVVTRLPFASSTATKTLPMGVPGLPEVGCDVKASLKAGPTPPPPKSTVTLLLPKLAPAMSARPSRLKSATPTATVVDPALNGLPVS